MLKISRELLLLQRCKCVAFCFDVISDPALTFFVNSVRQCTGKMGIRKTGACARCQPISLRFCLTPIFQCPQEVVICRCEEDDEVDESSTRWFPCSGALCRLTFHRLVCSHVGRTIGDTLPTALQ